MILVFGGTTEGRKAVQVLEEAGQPFYYSTKFGEQTLDASWNSREWGYGPGSDDKFL